jgi:CRP/FNR family nitrogen fixation transcriptional regulator
MKSGSHAADYYRRMLSAQPHGLKCLDGSATIVKCHRHQEIPNEGGQVASGII